MEVEKKSSDGLSLEKQREGIRMQREIIKDQILFCEQTGKDTRELRIIFDSLVAEDMQLEEVSEVELSEDFVSQFPKSERSLVPENTPVNSNRKGKLGEDWIGLKVRRFATPKEDSRNTTFMYGEYILTKMTEHGWLLRDGYKQYYVDKIKDDEFWEVVPEKELVGSLADVEESEYEWKEYVETWEDEMFPSDKKPKIFNYVRKENSEPFNCFHIRGHWLNEDWIGKNVRRISPPEGSFDSSFTCDFYRLLHKSQDGWVIQDIGNGTYFDVKFEMNDDRWEVLVQK